MAVDKELLVAAVPNKQKRLITDTVVDMINSIDEEGNFDGEFANRINDYASEKTQERAERSEAGGREGGQQGAGAALGPPGHATPEAAGR